MKILLSNKPSWRQYEKIITCIISPWNLKSQLWAVQTWDFDSYPPLSTWKFKKSLAYSRNIFSNGSFSKWIQAWLCLMTWSCSPAYLRAPLPDTALTLLPYIGIHAQSKASQKRNNVKTATKNQVSMSPTCQWLITNRDENVRQRWVYRNTSLVYFSTLQQSGGSWHSWTKRDVFLFPWCCLLSTLLKPFERPETSVTHNSEWLCVPYLNYVL